MREIFQQDLEQVGNDLVLMAQKVRSAVTDATVALETGDLALAEQVIAKDREIDSLQDGLDAQCVTLLARQQPVATDLRVVVVGLRLSATLERMGDLARHVAEIARGRMPEQALPEQARGSSPTWRPPCAPWPMTSWRSWRGTAWNWPTA